MAGGGRGGMEARRAVLAGGLAVRAPCQRLAVLRFDLCCRLQCRETMKWAFRSCSVGVCGVFLVGGTERH